MFFSTPNDVILSEINEYKLLLMEIFCIDKSTE